MVEEAKCQEDLFMIEQRYRRAGNPQSRTLSHITVVVVCLLRQPWRRPGANFITHNEIIVLEPYYLGSGDSINDPHTFPTYPILLIW